MENDKYSVMLSIIIPTYGQEKYIAQALDSVLMQKTQYTFEVLVGEDASPDNTRKILREYEQNYPGFFKIYYREENMSNHKDKDGIPCKNSVDLKLKAKGKYMITLEGDDYWISEDKIDRQISFLEANPKYMAVAHNCIVVDENSIPNGEKYPECKDDEYTFKHYRHDVLPGQCATVMHRNFWLDDDSDYIFFRRKNLFPGDRILYFYLITKGKIRCFQECLSAYRHVTNGGYSFSASSKWQFSYYEKYYSAFLEYSIITKNKEAIYSAEYLYFITLLRGKIHEHMHLREIVKFMKNIKHKTRIIFEFIFCGIPKYVKKLLNT